MGTTVPVLQVRREKGLKRQVSCSCATKTFKVTPKKMIEKGGVTTIHCSIVNGEYNDTILFCDILFDFSDDTLTSGTRDKVNGIRRTAEAK